MKNSKFVLGLFAALTVTALVACGDDSSSASAPVEDSVPVDPTQSSSSDVILSSSSNVILNGSEGSSSSSSNVILNESEGSSSSSDVILSSSQNQLSSITPSPSCGTAVYTEKCIDTEFEGETCAAIGCHPTDCIESQKGMEAYSCNGGSVMICDGIKWQYTNCAMPIIESSSSNSANSSSSNAANSSSSVILNGSEGSSSSNNILYSSSSEWRGGECINQEGDTRYDEMYEFQCKNGKWVIIGYRPGACVGDMDCGFSDGSAEQNRCKNVTIDNIKVEGSACSIAVDGYHKSENGCEFFCDGSKWIYTPPPMAL